MESRNRVLIIPGTNIPAMLEQKTKNLANYESAIVSELLVIRNYPFIHMCIRYIFFQIMCKLYTSQLFFVKNNKSYKRDEILQLSAGEQ